MSEVWSSLYFRTDDMAAVTKALTAAASIAGYTAFNPFTGAPSRTWPKVLRLFVAPAQGGWVRVLGQPDSAMLSDLASAPPCYGPNWKALVGGLMPGSMARPSGWKTSSASRPPIPIRCRQPPRFPLPAETCSMHCPKT